MTQIGTIEYEAKVSNVADAKKNAQDFADTQGDVAEASEESAAATGFLAAKMSTAEDSQDDASESAGRFDVASKLLASSVFWLGSAVGSTALKITGLSAAFGAAGTAAAGLRTVLGGLTLSGIMGSVTGALSSFAGWLAAGSAGALAVGAAIGVAIGLFGVWLLKITGVLGKVRALGQYLGEGLPAWARDGVLAIIGLFAGPLAAIGGFIVGTLDGGFSEGFARAKEVLGIFFGAWDRSFDRAATKLSNWKDKVVGYFVDLKNDGKRLIGDLGDSIGTLAKMSFNAVVPDKVTLPSTTLSAPDWAGGYSYTLGGQSLDLPQLNSGGMIREAGVAQVHKGEAVIPEPLVNAAKGGSGGGGTSVDVDTIVVNLDGEFDPTEMTRRDLEDLADRLVAMIGKRTNAKAGVR